MAEVETPPAEQRQRKSVAFSEGTTLIDGDGEVTTTHDSVDNDQTTAQAHSNGDFAVDEATAAFDDLALKKKKKSSKKKDAEKEETAEVPAGDAEFDPAALKKKKKKKPKTDETDDFEAKLAEASKGEAEEDEEDGKPSASAVDDGDMEEGTGVWSHDSSSVIPYDLLLSRFYKLLNAHNPDLMSSGGKSHKIPPPQCLREGNKKTIFANIAEICKRMKRSDEHMTSFIFSELGTTGSTDGNRRLVIKGKFSSKQIENVLRRYIVEYVNCRTCKSLDTELVRGENRLYFINCNSCGSRRSVQSIKAGFTAQVGKRRRQQG